MVIGKWLKEEKQHNENEISSMVQDEMLLIMMLTG